MEVGLALLDPREALQALTCIRRGSRRWHSRRSSTPGLGRQPQLPLQCKYLLEQATPALLWLATLDIGDSGLDDLLLGSRVAYQLRGLVIIRLRLAQPNEQIKIKTGEA